MPSGGAAPTICMRSARTMVLHSDGKGWADVGVAVQHPLRAIWGSGPADIWAFGDYGSPYTSMEPHGQLRRGARLQPPGGLGQRPPGYLGRGRAGLLRRWGDPALQRIGLVTVMEGVPGIFNGVWGSSQNDVYAIGRTVMHYDGLAWSNVNTGTSVAFIAIWGSGPDDVYLIGDLTIMHFDGDLDERCQPATRSRPASGAAGRRMSTRRDLPGRSSTMTGPAGRPWSAIREQSDSEGYGAAGSATSTPWATSARSEHSPGGWLGDVDGDGHVDVLDLLYLVDAFGSSGGDPNYDITCDFNSDGSVDVAHLLVLVDRFGK